MHMLCCMTVVFICTDYLLSFILLTPNILEGPKWLSTIGFIGTIFFIASLIIVLWEYFLKDITYEEWIKVSKVILALMAPWFALRLIWFPIIRVFTSYFVNQKLASNCKTLEWLNMGLLILGTAALMSVIYQYFYRKVHFGVLKNDNDETKNKKQPIIPKCPSHR